MTLAEFSLYLEGWKWRDDEAWFKVAYQTMWIVNHWRKEGHEVTVDDILPKREKPTESMTDEQMAENMLAWAIALGAEDKRKSKGAT